MSAAAPRAALLAAVALTAGCSAGGSEMARPEPAVPLSSSASALVASPPRVTASRPAATRASVVVVRYRIERRATDAATRDFAEVVQRTLTDPRGWQRAGFRLIEAADAPYVVLVAEAAEVDRLCRPYDTFGKYSCQNGPVVAINADRWRTATPEWTGDLATYRQMLVNHEVGHLLGQHHPPAPQCPRPGRPALVMAQQSTELGGCRPNPWPLPEEIARAARHDEPLAPPYSPS